VIEMVVEEVEVVMVMEAVMEMEMEAVTEMEVEMEVAAHDGAITFGRWGGIIE
jgi:hypothetical protein